MLGQEAVPASSGTVPLSYCYCYVERPIPRVYSCGTTYTVAPGKQNEVKV